MTDQLSMPMPEQPVRRSDVSPVAAMPVRKRRRCSLTIDEHNAIVFLRHHGVKVEAYGDQWFWTGRKRESKRKILVMAKAKGWAPGWKYEAKQEAATRQQNARAGVTSDLFPETIA
jgi:hypothetical protein